MRSISGAPSEAAIRSMLYGGYPSAAGFDALSSVPSTSSKPSEYLEPDAGTRTISEAPFKALRRLGLHENDPTGCPNSPPRPVRQRFPLRNMARRATAFKTRPAGAGRPIRFDPAPV